MREQSDGAAGQLNGYWKGGSVREREGAKETSSMATGIFKAETRGRSSWKEDVFVRMEQSPLPPTEIIQSDPKWTRKMASGEGNRDVGPQAEAGGQRETKSPWILSNSPSDHPFNRVARVVQKRQKTEREKRHGRPW